MAAFRAADAKEVSEVVTWAAAEEQPLEVIGGGSKRGLGRPMQVEHTLELSALAGILEYEATELVLTARAATPLAEIEAALDSERQMMAFEPPDLGVLLGTKNCSPTIGGTLSCNLAGPRRLTAGATRDHFLGFRGVNGRGEPYKAGGKVVKNVTGYDVCKLMAGAYGTLSVLTEVTIRVTPRPETERTVLVLGLADDAAIHALADGLNSPHDISGAAHLPHDVARCSGVPVIAAAGRAVTALRIEGPDPSTAYRCQALLDAMSVYGPTEVLDATGTTDFWREARNASLLAEPRERCIWRLSVTPSSGPRVAADIAARATAVCYCDWGGGLVWVAVADQPDGGADTVRTAIATHGGGHATLIRAPEPLRAAVSVLEPLPGPLAALSGRVKTSFDPHKVLNPGRMYAGI